MKKILLIEDDLFIRDITSKQLTQEGFDVKDTATAEKALEILSVELIDLIILDLDLPGMHGSDFLKSVKSDDKTSNIPVVVFSNSDTPEIEKSCTDAGADAFFIKINTDADELRTKIDELVNS